MTYEEYLEESKKDLVAMIHLASLPGTPKNSKTPEEIAKKAVEEALLYQKAGIRTVMIENMHDVPYTKTVGPEITATMANVAKAIKDLGLYCGVQVLAGCNKEALAIAHAASLDFVRAEGFVFGHLGDEGMFDACAGDLLRYRRMIGAERVLVFTDIKKKHSSHALTADVSLAETASAAGFFCSDGIIITGTSTGEAVSLEDLLALRANPIRKLIGSGLTKENLSQFFPLADIFIVGSHLKFEGSWVNSPDPDRVAEFVKTFNELRGNVGD